MSSSPYHAVAQWLAELLEPVRGKIAQFSLKDTFDFIQRIKDINISNRHMLSLDVQSLFTNVPLLETVNYLCDYISSNNIDLGLPLDKLKELILRCTFDVQFLFDGKFYRQRDGVAMGSPLGPLLADVFMSKLELGPLKDTISTFSTYLRYVDDIFVSCDSPANSHKILDYFNRCHPAIKFTLENELDDKLSFLDVLLLRTQDGAIQRKVHRKVTWTGQYTHFSSFVPLKYKRNLVKCLAYRARHICTPDTLDYELTFIRKTLSENGYPDNFVRRHMEPKPEMPANFDVPKKKVFLSVPFKGESSFQILKLRLSSAISGTFPAAQLCLLPRTRALLYQRTKDKLHPFSTNMCLYLFTCSCRADYLGRTTRRLSKRISEHCPKSLRTGNVKTITSAIMGHLIDTGHQVDTQTCFKVYYTVPNSYPISVRKRLLSLAEAIAIRILKPCLCKQKNYVQPLLLPWPS